MPVVEKGKSASNLAKEFAEKSSHNTLEAEQYSALIQARSSEEAISASDRVQSAIIKLNTEIGKSTNVAKESLNELTEKISDSADQLKTSVDVFNQTVKDIGESSDKLSVRVLWLNVVIALATVAGVIIAYYGLK